MRRYRSEIIVGFLLALATLALFWNVRDNQFVYDDRMYVTENPYVGGLTWANLVFAWTAQHGFWHPLTWMSLQLDFDLYGPGASGGLHASASGYHLTNLLLHTATVVLLFVALRWMTGRLWCSALVAAFFGVHPLNVESWAWVAERKGVLSTFFWMLALLAYSGYAERPSVGRYLLVVAALGLGLLSKPMLVTLPCVLLLLDFWPLRRVRLGKALAGDCEKVEEGKTEAPAGLRGLTSPARLSWLVAEKVPLLAVAAVFSLVAVVAERKVGALGSLDAFPVGVRVENAVESYAKYLGKAVWPVGLVPFYPYPFAPDTGTTLSKQDFAVSAVLLVGVSALVFAAARRRPYLAVGWLWYLGTLVPVIGLVQVGVHAMADRYAYVPLIGLLIMAVWGVADLAARRHAEYAAAAAAGALLVICAVLSVGQLRNWKDDVTMWSYTLRVNPDNWLAHYNLGEALSRKTRKTKADLDVLIAHFDRAGRLNPRDAQAFFNKGAALQEEGRIDDAIQAYRDALKARQDYPRAHKNLGTLLYARGEYPEAEEHLREGLGADRHNFECLYYLGESLALQGKWSEAQGYLAEAVEQKPAVVRVRCDLAFVHNRLNRPRDLKEAYRDAFRLDSHWPRDADREARMRAAHPTGAFRNGPLAVQLAREVCEATGESVPAYLDTLAAAYAENGCWEQAAATAEKARTLAADAGQTDLAGNIERRLRLYRDRKPYRDERLTGPDDPPFEGPRRAL